MNQIREYLKRPLIIGIVGFVVGLIIGLVVLGWWLWPVQWTDASPVDLHPGYQEIWLQMAITSYGATGDASKAKLAYDALGKSGAETLAADKIKPGEYRPEPDLTISGCSFRHHSSSLSNPRCHPVNQGHSNRIHHQTWKIKPGHLADRNVCDHPGGWGGNLCILLPAES